MTQTKSSPNPPTRFSWKAAAIGGAVAIGGTAFFGTLVANILLRNAMSTGATREQAYAALAASKSLSEALLTLLAIAAPAILGGYLSAQIGKGRAALHGGAAGVISLAFFGLMYANPSSQPGPAWFIALTLVVPVLSGLVGGALFARTA